MTFRILHYHTLDSTNNVARDFAEQGTGEGTVIVANYQTHGRGRFHRRWRSPQGAGLLFSVILRPRLRVSSISILTHLAAQSVRDALGNQLNLASRLKRPNDVLIGGKKVAGILTESCSYQNKASYVIVGVGVNVNTRPRDLLGTATSIFKEIKRKSDKNRILQEILRSFQKRYHDWNGAVRGLS